ncbi:MAG: L-serine ammonia-lyase [Phototrophicaceae bacterium]
MSQRISVFDMLKIGVGPSSSHTLGPWKATLRFLDESLSEAPLRAVQRVRVELFGSLAKTGRGHGTDIAVLMGLRGEDPVTCDTARLHTIRAQIREARQIDLLGQHTIPFDPAADIIWHYDQALPYHPNGMRLTADLDHGTVSSTFYSVGGGFVVKEGEEQPASTQVRLPYPCDRADEVAAFCRAHDMQLWQMVWANELAWRTPEQVRAGLREIWQTMLACAYRGCHTPGVLPGGLEVRRRAAQMHRKLAGDTSDLDIPAWLAHLRSLRYEFKDIVTLVSSFALAVNEENAAFGRVVTAPTNGAAGVLPAVLLYYVVTHDAAEDDIDRFLMVAGEIGTLFKKGATISAAEGGCQAEIGVSSAMAAGALVEALGGSVAQALMASEIAMEHHLGLTCDPIGGLVQIPCIERNTMGAMKAITAANIALASSPEDARVSLDTVIKALWDTARDMNHKYKETAEGGLAVHIPVNVIEC